MPPASTVFSTQQLIEDRLLAVWEYTAVVLEGQEPPEGAPYVRLTVTRGSTDTVTLGGSADESRGMAAFDFLAPKTQSAGSGTLRQYADLLVPLVRHLTLSGAVRLHTPHAYPMSLPDDDPNVGYKVLVPWTRLAVSA